MCWSRQHPCFPRPVGGTRKINGLLRTGFQAQTPTRLLTEVGPTAVPADIAGRLRVSIGDRVFVRRRLMLVDQEPVKVTASYFLPELSEGTRLAERELIGEGMHVFIEKELGRIYARYTEELMARMPTREEARALQLEPGTPVIQILHTDYDVEDVPVEVVESVFAGDRHVFVTEWPERSVLEDGGHQT